MRRRIALACALVAASCHPTEPADTFTWEFEHEPATWPRPPAYFPLARPLRCIDGIFRGEHDEDYGPYIAFEELDISTRIELRVLDVAHGDFGTPAEWQMCLASTF